MLTDCTAEQPALYMIEHVSAMEIVPRKQLLVSKTGKMTCFWGWFSDLWPLYPALSERLMSPGKDHALIFRGSRLFSPYQRVSIQAANPAPVIWQSEAAEWEQRRRAIITPTTFWTTATSAGRSVCTTLGSSHQQRFGSNGRIRRVVVQASSCVLWVRTYACWLKSAMCDCSCPTMDPVSDRIVQGCFLISFLILITSLENSILSESCFHFSISNLLSVIYS